MDIKKKFLESDVALIFDKGSDIPSIRNREESNPLKRNGKTDAISAVGAID
jgi:hypothetical protein